MAKKYNPENRAWSEIDNEYTAQTGYELHDALFTHVRALEEDQKGIHLQNIYNSRLYSNRDPLMFDWNSEQHSNFVPIAKNYENLIQFTCDTLVARLGANKPKATVYTRGADFSTYLRGRQLDKYLWAEFISLDIHRKVRRMFLDALVCGTGFLKIGILNDELCVERVCPDEIIVDQRECLNDTKPMQMFHRRLVPRQTLAKMYPRYKDEIYKAQGKNFQYVSYRSPSAEQVVVIEAYKLPTTPTSGDGKYSCAIENCTLYSEEYTDTEFPYIEYRWADPLQGYYGRSLVSDIIFYQIRHNELNDDIQSGQNTMCVPRIFVEQGSGIVGTEFDNQIGKVYTYRGTIPEVVTWSAFNTELYEERERNKAACLEFAALSQLMTSGKLPQQARLDSSEALREYNAITDDRFNDKAQDLEQVIINVARRICKVSAKLYAGKKEKFVNYISNNLVEQIHWSEVEMEADKYVLQISASSIVNMTPAARRDKLNTWFDKGLITAEQFMSWSGEPDLEHIVQLSSSGREYTEFMIDSMLRGEYQSPDVHMNLTSALNIVNDTYLYIRQIKTTPPEVLEIFRDWMVSAENLLNPEQEPQMVEPVQPGMMGQVDPMTGMPIEPPMSIPVMQPVGPMNPQMMM